MASLSAEEMFCILQGLGDYRVLRRVAVGEGELAPFASEATQVAAVVDVETTGLEFGRDRIIELALRRFRFDGRGRIVKIDRSFSWLEDPGRPLERDIMRITGLTDEQLQGEVIDANRAAALLSSASLVISHNAAFDRPFVEERVPAAAGLAWSCTCREVDWPAFGFDGRGLGWLLAQAGWFHDGHRAVADVDALIALLQHNLGCGRTVLGVLVENAGRPGWTVRAVGAHFDVKDRLRGRGYRWDASAKHWWREVRDDDLEEERLWLADFIYRPDLRPSEPGPTVEAVSSIARYVRAPLESACL